jgi:hypothetical protein
MSFRIQNIAIAAFLICTAVGDKASGCPFCSAESQTLSEETKTADAVVLAKLVKEAPASANAAEPNSGTAKFKIVEVIRSKDTLAADQEIDVVFFGDSDRNKVYLISGIGSGKIDWTTPLPLSPTAVEYTKKLGTVATSGADRLAFFQDYLENADPLLAQDAYDEFARAPYSELRDLKPRMQHDRIVKWVADPEVSPSRRRLYLTMLGVCGSKADLPLLEAMIVSDFDTMRPYLEQCVRTGLAMGGPPCLPLWIESVNQEEKRKKLGLDALVACYLILRGPDGLGLIEERFLKNPHTEYTYIYSTIMALRFHGDENTGVVPRERLLASMRLLLANPDFADQVVLDLSRWEDWSVLDKLVAMFKESDKASYIRQPVVSYLTVASDQPGAVGERAKAALADLETFDPETVKQARSLMAFGALGRARGVASSTNGNTQSSATTKTAVADPAQGLGATAEDNATNTADIPDPASFDASKQPESTNKSTGAANASQKQTADALPKQTTASKIPIAAPATNAGAPTQTTNVANPLLVAGIPLAAAALLMGVYWLILRAGAV